MFSVSYSDSKATSKTTIHFLTIQKKRQARFKINGEDSVFGKILDPRRLSTSNEILLRTFLIILKGLIFYFHTFGVHFDSIDPDPGL